MPEPPFPGEPGPRENEAVFNPIVVAPCLASSAHRAARSLAELGDVPIQLLPVSAAWMTERIDSDERARTADDHGVTPRLCVIERGRVPAIAGPMNSRHGSRPVMATTATSPVVDRGLGTVTPLVPAGADAPVVAAYRDRAGEVTLPILHGAHR